MPPGKIQDTTGQAQYASADLSKWEQDLKEKEMYLDAGFVGKLFGNGTNCINNIAGLTIILAILVSCLINGISLWNKFDQPYEIWKITSPLITAALGFIFGQHINPGRNSVQGKAR